MGASSAWALARCPAVATGERGSRRPAAPAISPAGGEPRRGPAGSRLPPPLAVAPHAATAARPGADRAPPPTSAPYSGYGRQRLRERLQPRGGLPHLGGRLGEQGQVIRAFRRRPRRSIGGQALLDLPSPLLPVSTGGLCPAPQGRCLGQFLREPLRGRDGHGGLGACLGRGASRRR